LPHGHLGLSMEGIDKIFDAMLELKKSDVSEQFSFNYNNSQLPYNTMFNPCLFIIVS
jgi:hypothetical protein